MACFVGEAGSMFFEPSFSHNQDISGANATTKTGLKIEITGRHSPAKNFTIGLLVGKISKRSAGLLESRPEENHEKSNHVDNSNALFLDFGERTVGNYISRNNNTQRKNKCADNIKLKGKVKTPNRTTPPTAQAKNSLAFCRILLAGAFSFSD